MPLLQNQLTSLAQFAPGFSFQLIAKQFPLVDSEFEITGSCSSCILIESLSNSYQASFAYVCAVAPKTLTCRVHTQSILHFWLPESVSTFAKAEQGYPLYTLYTFPQITLTP